jgi:predicted metal-dependent hydrolase
VRFSVNARARRISVRIDAVRREAVAVSPSARRLMDAARFAESRARWIAERLDALPVPARLEPGAVIEVGGAPCRLERAAMRIVPRLIAATLDEPQRLIASGDGEAYNRAVMRALKAEALRRLTRRTAVHAAALHQPAPSLAVADPRSRWGSCKGGNAGAPAAIRYNWRLVLAPDWVLDYVAAHECAHLIEANHGPRFWALVDRLYGDHRPARAWLAEHGARLHAVGR